jgi:hypothetical protein
VTSLAERGRVQFAGGAGRGARVGGRAAGRARRPQPQVWGAAAAVRAWASVAAGREPALPCPGALSTRGDSSSRLSLRAAVGAGAEWGRAAGPMPARTHARRAPVVGRPQELAAHVRQHVHGPRGRAWCARCAAAAGAPNKAGVCRRSGCLGGGRGLGGLLRAPLGGHLAAPAAARRRGGHVPGGMPRCLCREPGPHARPAGSGTPAGARESTTGLHGCRRDFKELMMTCGSQPLTPGPPYGER